MKKLLGSARPVISKFILNFSNCLDFYFKPCYSQEGEDMVLRAIFHGQKRGFYIDIGAHHPKLFSNTYFFYKEGWRGINIDAMPGSMDLFRKIRKKDINIEAAISDKKETLTYFAFNEPALNTFSSELAEERKAIPKFKLLFTEQISTEPLGNILDSYLPAGQEIDFLTIDVEGLDLRVLKSNNWLKYRPKIILVESLNFAFSAPADDPLVAFLNEKEYRLFSKTVNTLFFAHKSFNYNTY